MSTVDGNAATEAGLRSRAEISARAIGAVVVRVVVWTWILSFGIGFLLTWLDPDDTSWLDAAARTVIGKLVVGILIGSGGLVVAVGVGATAVNLVLSVVRGIMAAPEVWETHLRRRLARFRDPSADEFWTDTEIRAWRSWWWNGGCLEGMRVNWPMSSLEATCSVCDEVPGWSHACGIYALKDPKQRSWVDRNVVHGEVALSGLVIEHDGGYRAQYARIVSLLAPTHLVDDLRFLYPDVEIIPQSKKEFP